MAKYQVYPSYLKYLLGLNPKTTDSRDWQHAHPLIYGDKTHEPNLELYIKLMRQAAKQTDNPVLKCWFKMEEVNAWRRMLTRPTVERASKLLTKLRPMIEDLDSPRKWRLLTLWFYHGAEIFRLLGDFKKTAALHQEAAELATTQRDKLHAEYMAACALLNEALVSGTPRQDLDNRYVHFMKKWAKFFEFLTTVKDDDQYVIQWEGNLRWDDILFGFLVNLDLPDKGTVEFLENLPENLTQAFAEAMIIVHALAQLDQDPNKALEIASSKGKWEDVDFQAIAILVQAEAIFRLGGNLKSKLAEIAAICQDALGGYVANAIASCWW